MEWIGQCLAYGRKSMIKVISLSGYLGLNDCRANWNVYHHETEKHNESGIYSIYLSKNSVKLALIYMSSEINTYWYFLLKWTLLMLSLTQEWFLAWHLLVLFISQSSNKLSCSAEDYKSESWAERWNLLINAVIREEGGSFSLSSWQVLKAICQPY